MYVIVMDCLVINQCHSPSNRLLLLPISIKHLLLILLLMNA